MSSTDYSGRTLDLHIMQNVIPLGKAVVTLSLEEPAVTAGIQKAIQKWLVAFLTRKGTVLSDPTYGTTFMSDVASANISSDQFVHDLFGRAANDLNIWFSNNVDQTSLEDDEIIEEAQLEQINFDQEVLELRVKFTMKSGTNFTYLMPLNRVPEV